MTVCPTSASDVIEQRAAYAALLQSLGQATFEETEAVMREREEAAPESGLSPQVVKRLQERLAQPATGSSQA